MLQKDWEGHYYHSQAQKTYPEEPEDEVLLLPQAESVSVGRDSIANQPETECPSEDVNVFLHVHMQTGTENN